MEIKFEYGFESVNGVVKKVYSLAEIPNIKEKCDVWNVLPIAYVRQFIGLTDKSGVDIYNGDIISDESESFGVVVWNDDSSSFLIQYGDELQWFENGDVSWGWICGNIFEAPDLLTQQPTK